MGQLSKEDMVERVSWFSPIDYEILIFFENHDIIVSPKILSVNIGYDRQYTSKRMNVLADNDLLKKRNSGLYELSKTGRLFLAGNLDPSSLE